MARVVTVRTEGDVEAALSDGTYDLPGVFDAATGVLATDPIFGPGDRYLRLEVGGPYTASVSADGLVAVDPPADLPVTLELSAEATEVAAYSLSGQRVGGTLAITNQGDDDLDARRSTRRPATSRGPRRPPRTR